MKNDKIYGMELQEYIVAVVTDIVEAVSELNNKNDEEKKYQVFAPGVKTADKSGLTGFDVNSHKMFTNIKFKISVGVSSTKEKGAKGGIRVLSANIDGGVKHGFNEESLNVIEFALPVEFS
ncbi:hypothetical protein SDC9_52665 [bioreactor metagenome]|uniref:Uncharacterized protein n=1 Tax=bioreactor metagenome TaxID=1076179 RepID=A0A644WR38_9ZZZZ